MTTKYERDEQYVTCERDAIGIWFWNGRDMKLGKDMHMEAKHGLAHGN